MTKQHKLRIKGPVGPIETVIEEPSGTPSGLALIAHPHPLKGGSLDNKVAWTLARAAVSSGLVAVRPNFRGVGESAGTHDDGRGETEDMLAVLAEARCRYGDLPVALAGFSFGAYVQTRVAQALAEANHPAQRLVLVGTAAGHVEGARQYATKAVASDSIGETDDLLVLVAAITAHYGKLPWTLMGFSFGAYVQHRVAQELHAERLIMVGPAVSMYSFEATHIPTTILHGTEDEVIPFQAAREYADTHAIPLIAIEGAGHFFHGKLRELQSQVEALCKP